MPSVHLDCLHSNPNPIQWLDGQQVLPEAEVGWKAAILSEIHCTGEAVPPGFVISPPYFQGFLQGLALSLEQDVLQASRSLPSPPALQLWKMAEALQAQVDTLPLPAQWERSLQAAYQQLRQDFPNSLYILRPSIVSPKDLLKIAPLQTTGLLEAVLNPSRDSGEASLWLQFCQSLRALYRQCFQTRSLLYWNYHQLALTELPVAVLVQPLLPSLASGTIEISPHEVTITATWGVGLSLTRGEIVPDRYCRRRSDSAASTHFGQKDWVYWHPHTPQAVDVPLEIPLPDPYAAPASASPLMVQRVALGVQHQAVLNTPQREELEEKALALQARVPEINTLEWVLCPSLTNPSHLSIVWIEGNPAPLSGSQTPGVQSPGVQSPAFRSPAPHSEQTPGSEPPHRHGPPIQGQGVSGGVQGGHVYSLQALSLQPPLSLESPIILVGQQLTPEVIPWLKRVRGLVLGQGGTTSHGAILARELEIPAVVGVDSDHLESLLSFPWVMVDGTGGRVQGFQDCPPIATFPAATAPPQHQAEDGSESPALPLKIFATLNQSASLSALRHHPADGIGLLRSEWFFLDLWHGQHPHRWIAQGRQRELRTAYQERLQQCIQAIHPRPLFYRSVDCRAAELQSLGGQNTFPWNIGGSFAHNCEPSVLNLEFEVLHQIDRGDSPLHLVLPMVRTVEEFIGCRDHYQQFLQQQVRSPSPLPLWIMAEVPSILLQLPALAAAGVQGVVIGPGDLCQYWLGLSREQWGPLTYELDHPLVHQVMLQLLTETQRLKLPTILSSHSGSIPQTYLEDYLRAGLWGITTELPHLKALRQTIAFR